MGKEENIKGKLRYDLLPPEPIEEMVRVLQHPVDSGKYEKDDWKNVENPIETYYAALMRHLQGWRKGEKIDKGDNLPAMAHVMACSTILMWHESQTPAPQEMIDALSLELANKLGKNYEGEPTGLRFPVYYLCYPYRDRPSFRLRVISHVAARFQEEHLGSLVLIPHFMFQYMNEETERSKIIASCQDAVRLSTTLVVVGTTISEGMEIEIKEAESLGIPIIGYKCEEEEINADRCEKFCNECDPRKGLVNTNAALCWLKKQVEPKTDSIIVPRVPRFDQEVKFADAVKVLNDLTPIDKTEEQ